MVLGLNRVSAAFLKLRKRLKLVVYFGDLETEAQLAVFSPQNEGAGGGGMGGHRGQGGQGVWPPPPELRVGSCWSLKLGKLACTRLNSISELVSGGKGAFFPNFLGKVCTTTRIVIK